MQVQQLGIPLRLAFSCCSNPWTVLQNSAASQKNRPRIGGQGYLTFLQYHLTSDGLVLGLGLQLFDSAPCRLLSP